ncbi:MAG: nucleotidyltransferase domain-containing protein [Nitrospinae bacterium]|nr:nucleotidyltransferase domain-containing protein [Nitrospinota bacterium]
MSNVAGIITDAANHIAEEKRPEKIILFGSRAWGEPAPDSDWDLLIIVPSSDEPPYRRARNVYKCLRGLGADVEAIVLTHDEVEQAAQVSTSIVRSALSKGIVLYG